MPGSWFVVVKISEGPREMARGAVHTAASERTVALDPRTHISDPHVPAPFAV